VTHLLASFSWSDPLGMNNKGYLLEITTNDWNQDFIAIGAEDVMMFLEYDKMYNLTLSAFTSCGRSTATSLNISTQNTKCTVLSALAVYADTCTYVVLPNNYLCMELAMKLTITSKTNMT